MAKLKGDDHINVFCSVMISGCKSDSDCGWCKTVWNAAIEHAGKVTRATIADFEKKLTRAINRSDMAAVHAILNDMRDDAYVGQTEICPNCSIDGTLYNSDTGKWDIVCDVCGGTGKLS